MTAFTGTIAIFTIVLAISTILLWLETRKTAKRSEATIRTSERAYVKMSHVKPGILFDDTDGSFVVQLQINFGKTPASVSDVLACNAVITDLSKLPSPPDYSQGPTDFPSKAFLVADDEFFHVRNRYPKREFGEDKWAEIYDGIKNGRCLLCSFGYVDYTDAFGQRHRGGYARVYDPQRDIKWPHMTDKEFADRNNLLVVAREDYNYDRPRNQGEGNDWQSAGLSQPS